MDNFLELDVNYLYVSVNPDPAGQFANPYSYGGDPVNYQDPNGEFVVAACVGAVIGAGFGAYKVYQGGYHAGDWQTWAYIRGGAAIGAAAAATGGAVGGAFFTATGSTIAAGAAAGAAGGAVGGGLNYTLDASIQQNFTMGGFARATAIGAASGMVGGGVGGAIGGGAFGAIGGGFSGGATGSYLNGKRGMDVVYGGLMGAGVALAGYSGMAAINAAVDYFNPIDQETGFSKEGLKDLYNKQLEAAKDPNSFLRKKLEYGLIDENNEAVKLEYDHLKDVNRWPKGSRAFYRVIHAHGEAQTYRTPSPGDYRAASAYLDHGINPFLMDVPTKTIQLYNRTNVVETYQYNPDTSYRYYWNQHFRF